MSRRKIKVRLLSRRVVPYQGAILSGVLVFEHERIEWPMEAKRGRPKDRLTLSEICARAGVGRTAAQRYKKRRAFADHAVGEGRKARYYLSAVPALKALRDEGLAKRGKRNG